MANISQITEKYVALLGNPNSGKTAIFNLLTGLNQKVSNYPGITVDRKLGKAIINGNKINILDLPGTYSITPESLDERVVTSQILSWLHHPESRPSLLISVLDASNLNRNLYLASQLSELDIPLILVLNMMDRVENGKLNIDLPVLKDKFNAVDVILFSAVKKNGLKELKDSIHQNINIQKQTISNSYIQIPSECRKIFKPITSFLENEFNYKRSIAESMSIRLVTRDSVMDAYQTQTLINEDQLKRLSLLIATSSKELNKNNYEPRTIEAQYRYHWIDKEIISYTTEPELSILNKSRSETVDNILTHSFLGPIIFLSLLYFIFQSIFTWASLPMDLINNLIGGFGEWVLNTMPSGLLRDLIVEGVIAGVGAILIFLPQIIILILFLAILEDSGYMARVAFMMDRLMSSVGLHGRSVLPMMSGYACAIPGIIASRNIDSWKERLITILILPLMSCSARLPVYTLMINAFVPQQTVLGFFQLQGLVMVVMYLLGSVTAFFIAKIFSIFIKEKGQSSFVMELPPYRIPMLRSLFNEVYIRAKSFVTDAGKIIMAISIVLWFLVTFPKSDATDINPIHQSYAGQIGHAIEPLIEPLGFDWKIGIGLITSFAAREVLVSTLATIYSVELADDSVVNLVEVMRADTNPKTGLPKYTLLVALSLMVFYVYAAQCMATFAIVKNETNSWKWPAVMIIYMTTLAYLGSLVVYQGGQYLGLS